MDLQRINPLDHPEWDDALLASGDFSFFHTSTWARVIAESYGYRPVCFVRRGPAGLSFVMPFMDISSRLTGRRGVSLPFTDFCVPFEADGGSREEAVRTVCDHGRAARWRYIEWRTAGELVPGAKPSESFLTHDLDIGRSEQDLRSGMDEGHRRNLKKAQESGLLTRIDGSRGSLEDFYRLHVDTRKRHGLPPQPLSFFRNILDHVFSRGLGIVVSAAWAGKVVASSVFFRFGPTAIFKYGASDPRGLAAKPNNLVMWEAIKWCRERGIKTLNLGRTELDNPGLQRFKRSWGASESTLNYYRYDLKQEKFSSAPRGGDRPKRLFSMMPPGLLRLVGRMCYRHIG